ncbi:MAG TPA: HAD-IB family hydrolase [Haliangiales bacterium]|nr:HAD-IB family hydrolase [Haliangiales bacterium]
MVTIEARSDVKQAAFFDLEKTLTAQAAEQACALMLARRRQLPVSSLLRVLAIYLKYNLGLIADFDAMKRSGAQIFVGRRPDRDVALAQALFDERLHRFIFPEAERLVRGFRERGIPVYIVSSTYRFIVAPYARHLGATDYYGCELEAVDGVCTGRIIGTIYHQEHKAAVVQEIAQRDGVSLAHSYAFGDSLNDRPMLECVGHPVAVNPGGKLRRIAEARGWRIARWRA